MDELLGRIFALIAYVRDLGNLINRDSPVDHGSILAYTFDMGLFSKPKSKTQVAMSEDQINGLVLKFQSWIPDSFLGEFNGNKYSAPELKNIVDFLVRVSARTVDEQLLQFVAKSCAGFNEPEEASVEHIAQFLFDGTVVSMELRKRYAEVAPAVEGIVTLGLAVLSTLEKHPKFPAVLEYTSANSHKLAGN